MSEVVTTSSTTKKKIVKKNLAVLKRFTRKQKERDTQLVRQMVESYKAIRTISKNEIAAIITDNIRNGFEANIESLEANIESLKERMYDMVNFVNEYLPDEYKEELKA